MKLSKFQNDLSKYNAEAQLYQSDASIQLQEYQAQIQKSTTEYQWYAERQARVKLEYDSKFVVAPVRMED